MKHNLDPHIRAGLDELSKKSLRQVQIDTALKWTGRAVAAMKLGFFEDAHEYAHEALEHAALTGDDSLLRVVRAALKKSGAEA